MTQADADRLHDAAADFFREFRAKPYGPVGVRIGNLYVEISVYAYDDDIGYRIGALENYGARGRGKASELLRRILRMADDERVPVYLTPEPFGTRPDRSYEELVAWYTRHGFAIIGTVKSRNSMEEIVTETLMKRVPQ